MIEVIGIEQKEELLHVTADLPDAGVEQHLITLHPDALGSRMVFYDLESPAEAFDAIMREHCRRLTPGWETPIGKEASLAAQVHDAKKIEVVILCREAVDELIDRNIVGIKDAYHARKGA